MRLTEREKKLVARRAYGEYAINESVDRIWRTHRKKNRSLDDAPYLEFLRVLNKKTFDWDEYVTAAQPLHDLHPYPWGPEGEPEIPPNPDLVHAESPQKKRRRRTPKQIIREAEIAPPSPPKKKRRRRKKAPPKEEIVPPEPAEEPEGPTEETTEDGMVMGDDGFMWLPPGWEPLEE